jgi:hypothetical protein
VATGAAKIIRELLKYLCALFARTEEDEGTKAFGDHNPHNSRTSATLCARRNEITRCAMSSTATLRNETAELMAAATATSLSLFNAAVSSSSTNTRGRRISVRTIAARARCPPESLCPRSPTNISSPPGRPIIMSWLLLRAPLPRPCSWVWIDALNRGCWTQSSR